MMGTRQKIKTALEYDVLYRRGQYCYLINNCSLKRFVKKSLSRRRRQENKIMLSGLTS